MVGTPITHFGKFSEGTNGYIVIMDANDLFLETVNSIVIQNETDVSLTAVFESETDLITLNGYLNSSSYPNAAWFQSSSLIYLFLSNAVYPYTNDIIFTVLGTRTGIPIRSLDDYIDIPEKHLELFIKYAIREAAQLLGRQIPPAIIKDITELESNL